MPSPLTVTFIQATILNAISNVLAQLIDQRNSKSPFHLNPIALIQFVTYGLIIVPPNFYWQRALEARYPGFPTRAEFTSAVRSFSLKAIFSPRAWLALFSGSSKEETLPSHDKEKEKHVRWAPRVQNSGLRNFIMKFFFDQTVASVTNLVLFVVLINLLKGRRCPGCGSWSSRISGP
ncbi:hypothetical protein N7467_006845 [Penicillium canescens]|nr:hypothetical protein N7467_006845 [Penicillium canescens]